MKPSAILLAAVPLFIAGGAHAQSQPINEHYEPAVFQSQSALSRAQVGDELTAARKSGHVSFNEADYPFADPIAHPMSRAEMNDQIARARESATLWTNEAGGPLMGAARRAAPTTLGQR